MYHMSSWTRLFRSNCRSVVCHIYVYFVIALCIHQVLLHALLAAMLQLTQRNVLGVRRDISVPQQEGHLSCVRMGRTHFRTGLTALFVLLDMDVSM